jgi:hypothetical protein
MSFEAAGWAIRQRPKTPTEKLVLISLADHHNRSTGQCDPSYSTLADDALCSRRQAMRCVQSLEEQGFISVRKRSTFSCFYTLHFDIQAGDRVSPVVRGTGDSLSPAASDSLSPADTSLVTSETPTGDTHVTSASDMGVTLTRNTTRKNQEEVPRVRTEPPPPPLDVPRSWLPIDNETEFVAAVRDAWVEQWADTAADSPPSGALPSSIVFGLRSAIGMIERDNPDLKPRTADYWRALFRHLAKSDFLAGRKLQADGRPFRMRLHWLLREDNLAKCRAHEYCEPHHCGHVRPAAQVSR